MFKICLQGLTNVGRVGPSGLTCCWAFLVAISLSGNIYLLTHHKDLGKVLQKNSCLTNLEIHLLLEVIWNSKGNTGN